MKKHTNLLLSLFFLLPLIFAEPAKSEKTHIWSPEDIERVNPLFTGDYGQMVEKRLIRVLIPYSKTFFFYDGAKPRGASYELIQQFESFINKKLNTGTLKVNVIVIPTARKNLIGRIRDGKGDIAVGNLTITDNRLKEVDFSNPVGSDISEILVSGADSPDLKNIFDLAGKEIFARKSSSYHESLVRLNETLTASNKKKIQIIAADDHLEDEDLLEMVNAGLIKYMVIDSHKGRFWAKIFDKIKLHENLKLRTEGKIGWAIRKNNPELKAIIDEFVKEHKIGTLLGNIIFNRYFKNTSYITNSIYNEHLQRFKVMVQFFEKFGEQYHFDALMLAALGYQESKLDQSVRSSRGAVGVMQILPSTAKDKNVAIPQIDKIEPNIHAGTKYLRFMTDRYFSGNEKMNALDKTLFTFASYNAGPAKVARLRKEAEQMGLNPDVWFNNVEVVAAKRIGRETVQYVSNIFKYYIAYTLISEKILTDEPVHLSGSSKKKKKDK